MSTPGVDLILPDLDFIEERADDLVGIVITHAHEDHIGAIPYLVDALDAPIYATPFTAELIRRKLDEAGLARTVELIEIEREGEIELDPFRIRYVPMAHSTAEANALLIETAYGRVFHSGDWKLDEQPIVGRPASEAALRRIGDEGVNALVCDSTNVFNEEPSGSEGEVRAGLLEEVRGHDGHRVLVTTFASNVARLDTLGFVARETDRRLCVAGRSLDRMIEVAQRSGYLSDLPDRVDWDTAMGLPRGDVLIVATGGQGEPRAALSRIAENRHPIELAQRDVVLFSSRQIPGNEIAIGKMQNALAAREIEIVISSEPPIHVSGHPARPELAALYEWIRPQLLVPVHGEMRHLREQARLAREEGVPSAIVQTNGDIVRLAPGKPQRLAQIETGRLALDGEIIVPADGGAIGMRRRIAAEGALVVVLDRKDGVRIESFGLPLEEDMDDFLAEAKDDVRKAIAKLKGENDNGKTREAARLAARRAARRWCGKSPQVRVLLSTD